MKKSLLFALTLSMVGCTTTKQPTIPTITQAPAITNILYYDVDPVHMGQATAVVVGRFAWEDGCIYLVADGYKRTAMFPKLPENSVSWNETEKVLVLRNADDLTKEFEFKMGDGINTNGHRIAYSTALANSFNETDRKCLSKDGIAFVGTFSIDKY